MTETETAPAWPHDCQTGIEDAIAEFRIRLPGWWYTLGECQVSCDASCAPTPHSGDMALIELDDRFDSGFHADLRQPSTLAKALRTVMNEALVARSELGRMHVEATMRPVGGPVDGEAGRRGMGVVMPVPVEAGISTIPDTDTVRDHALRQAEFAA